MAEVIRNLEACLSIAAPNSKPYTLQEIEAVSRKVGGEEGAGMSLDYSSDSVSDSSPSIRRAPSSPSILALRSSAGRIPTSSGASDSSASDSEVESGSGFDDDESGILEGGDDREEDSMPYGFQPLAYYIGVIKAHLEIRRPERTRKVSGMKRETLRKEYVLVPIEEASRVLNISTTKLSRAYKSLSILSRCGWVFKGRKRRLRWPTRPLRVLLKYICEKYLSEMAATYAALEEQKNQSMPRTRSLDHILN